MFVDGNICKQLWITLIESVRAFVMAGRGCADAVSVRPAAALWRRVRSYVKMTRAAAVCWSRSSSRFARARQSGRRSGARLTLVFCIVFFNVYQV